MPTGDPRVSHFVFTGEVLPVFFLRIHFQHPYYTTPSRAPTPLLGSFAHHLPVKGLLPTPTLLLD